MMHARKWGFCTLSILRFQHCHSEASDDDDDDDYRHNILETHEILASTPVLFSVFVRSTVVVLPHDIDESP